MEFEKPNKKYIFSNIGLLIFFSLYLTTLIFIFQDISAIAVLLVIQVIWSLFSLSLPGESIHAFFLGAKTIHRYDMRLKLEPILEMVLEKANVRKNVQLKYIESDDINAYALGCHTIIVTSGLCGLPDKLILAILSHEVGHIVYRHSALYTVIGIGNPVVSIVYFLLKLICVSFSTILSGISALLHQKFLAILSILLGAISIGAIWLWMRFCSLFFYWSMRQNEFMADAYAANLGFGYEMAVVIDQYLVNPKQKTVFSALLWTHPSKHDRIAALQKIGVGYYGV